MKTATDFLTIGVLALTAAACTTAPAPFATTPVVEPWSPAAIKSGQFESHPAFDPRTGDLWFVRSNPDFSHWRLWVAPCGPNGWTAPHEAPIAGDGVDADPWFTPDGSTLWFISNNGTGRKDTDIWRVTRDKDGKWGTPERLPAPINTTSYEWFPRPGADGWLYFGSGREGGSGGNDIWRAKEESGAWKVENLGPNINSSAGEYEPLPTPDGRFLIVETDDGYYWSERKNGAWSPKVRFGPEINVSKTEIGAALSPSGRTMLFARDTKGPASGEIFVAHFGAPEAWPQCPMRRG